MVGVKPEASTQSSLSGIGIAEAIFSGFAVVVFAAAVVAAAAATAAVRAEIN